MPVVRVRTLGSVGSRTQLSLRCDFSDYVLRNNCMFRPMVAIFRLSREYLRATVKLYRAHNVEISTCLVCRGSIPPQQLHLFIYIYTGYLGLLFIYLPLV